MPPIRPLLPGLSLTSQVAPEDMPELVRLGFRTLICNRPDDEDPGQPTAQSLAAAAKEHGIVFIHQPVGYSKMTPEDGKAFCSAVANSPGAVLAFCKSGMRSAGLWALGRAAELGADQVLETCACAGFAVEGLRPRLPQSDGAA